MVNTNCKTERMLDYFFGKLAGFTVWTGLPAANDGY